MIFHVITSFDIHVDDVFDEDHLIPMLETEMMGIKDFIEESVLHECSLKDGFGDEDILGDGVTLSNLQTAIIPVEKKGARNKTN